ncbi:jg11325 [Pararge aegeria aegeria]|uniref:Jg11325 protein n=1 Tax=Pararge aegeria aegeria TaxID=348720 RepID=A0A8S4RM78_9NEOP|nr:jg11325 [Pararge aegeria aegeria]
MICGFCSETDEEFEQTMTLMEIFEYNVAFLFPYSMRERGSLPLTSLHSTLLLDPGPDDIQTGKDYPLADITMAYGFPVEDPSTGSAEGYIGEDHNFYGVLYIGQQLFIVKSTSPDDAPVSERNVRRGYIAEDLFGVGVRADFNEDGVPDNIGFSVKYILVLTSRETNNRVFGDIVNDRALDGRHYLMRFSRLRRLSEVCLGVAFSGHMFLNSTLGLSFTSLGGGLGGAAGGLCDRRAYGRSFNSLALAHATQELNERVPERVAALNLAHEIGMVQFTNTFTYSHSFGAHHDEHFPNPDCRGYVMGSQSSPTNSAHPSEFSICSKRLISATLSSMSYCLSEIDQPFCGNGIVEDGEICDCGLPSLCNQKDPCCTPRAGGALVFEEGFVLFVLIHLKFT